MRFFALLLAILLFVAGLMCVLVAFIPDQPEHPRTFGDKALTLVIGLIMVAGALTMFLVRMYNRLVSARLSCDKSWSNIDVLLKRRHDLIDNLVKTVGRYAEHERETFTEVAQYRSQASGTTDVAERGHAEAGLQAAMGRLLVVAESYPDLKANENFQRLSGQLSETENSIATSRTTYNDAVEAMNAMVRKFPSMIAARLFRYEEKSFFQIEVAERDSPAAAM